MLSTLTYLSAILLGRPKLYDEVITTHKSQALIAADAAAAQAKDAGTHAAVARATASEISDRYPGSSDARDADKYATGSEVTAAFAASFAADAKTAASTSAVQGVQVESATSALELTKSAASDTRALVAAAVVVLARCVARNEGRPFALPLTPAPSSKNRQRSSGVSLPVCKKSRRDKSPSAEERPSPESLEKKLLALKEHYVEQIQALEDLRVEKIAIMGRYDSDLAAVRQCLPPEFGIYAPAAVEVVEERKDAALRQLSLCVENIMCKMA